MADIAREIVRELNEKPFERSMSLVKLDELKPIQLLQLLNDVFSAIAPDHKIDVRQEDPEDMIVRMLSLLRVLRYKPPTPAGFKQGLVGASTDVVYPILKWCLLERESLKQRAYLANFLMRIEVPAEFLQNEQVAETERRYRELVEEFQEAHKDVEALRTSGFSTQEIKRDISHMEEEIRQLTKRIERMRQKFSSVSNSGMMLSSARALRLEHEREEQLEQQRVDQRNQLRHAEEKLQRSLQLLKDARANSVAGGVEGLLTRMEDEYKGEMYIATEKLPQAIEEREETQREFQRVLDEPAMNDTDLDKLHSKIQELTSETNSLVEARMAANDKPGDDKLRLFKQQAMLIARKKAAMAEKVHDATEELANTRKEHEAAKAKAGGGDGGPRMLKADEFQIFVGKLRSKNTRYKEKRSALSELRQEFLILSGTQEQLQAGERSNEAVIARLENKHGVTGFGETQDNLEKVSAAKEELDEQKGRALEDISEMVDRLHKEIDAKQEFLAPIIKELRELRIKGKDMKARHDEKKGAYDRMVAGLESNKSKLEADVRAYKEEIAADESRYHYLHNMTRMLSVQQKRIQDEMAIYVGQNKDADAFRDLYLERIQEQENQGKHLREKQKIVKASHEPNMRQLDMWRDLKKIMDCKVDCMQEASQAANAGMPSNAGFETDRLVL